MTDSIQIMLTVVVTTLTVLLVLIGIQLFLVLNEFRNILKKSNKMADDALRVTHAVVTPVEEASSFLMGLKNGLGLIKSLKNIFNSAVEEEVIIQSNESGE